MVEMKETTQDKRTASRIGYWREQVVQQERSGLTVKQYCERQGVAEQSFYVWRKRLREESPVRFALVETSPQKEAADDVGLEIVFRTGEHLRIGRAADLVLLRRIVDALRG